MKIPKDEEDDKISTNATFVYLYIFIVRNARTHTLELRHCIYLRVCIYIYWTLRIIFFIPLLFAPLLHGYNPMTCFDACGLIL
jgi:hypothetical protein